MTQLHKLLVALALMLPLVHMEAQTFPALVQGSVTTQNLAPAGAATAGSAVELLVPAGAPAVSVQVSGTYTGALSVQVSTDSANYVTLAGASAVTNVATAVATSTIPSAAVGVYSVNPQGALRLRVTGLAAMTGAAVVTLRAAGI